MRLTKIIILQADTGLGSVMWSRQAWDPAPSRRAQPAGRRQEEAGLPEPADSPGGRQTFLALKAPV